ncbi:TniQ family protein [Paraburkholderia atlantica]|uniref:TniQ family protein n=1 Tax=Paraburkholderia atlantica TaxID=2654982 RepID=UPI0003A0B6B0|nr:TniQ family protein [Paraburkholderia atlantica]
MALYLDSPHTGEVLVSVLGRFMDDFHVQSRNEFIQWLFGYLPTFSTHYMSNLAAIACETAQSWGWTYEKIAQELTIFPYLKAYLSQADADNLLAACRTIVSKSAIGRELNGLVRAPTRVLVCPECFREDRVERRPQYWRRAHQLPAVIFCWKHKIKLRMITVGRSGRIWHTPGSLQGLDEDIPVELSAEQRQRCIAVAELSNELLSGSKKLIRDRLLEYWIRVLQGKGSARGACLFSEKHAHAIRAFFGDSYLQFVGFPAEPKFAHSRLIKYATRPGTSALEFLLWNVFISDLGSQLNWVTWPLCPGAVRTSKAGGPDASEFERLAKPSQCICGRCVTFAENQAARWPTAYDQPSVRGVTRPLHEREQRSRQYTGSIKEKAITRYREPGATVGGVARELGIGYDALRRWVLGPRRERKHSCCRGMLTSGEAARILEVSIKKFNRLAESGALGAFRRTRGGHRRFSRESILAHSNRTAVTEKLAR